MFTQRILCTLKMPDHKMRPIHGKNTPCKHTLIIRAIHYCIALYYSCDRPPITLCLWAGPNRLLYMADPEANMWLVAGVPIGGEPPPSVNHLKATAAIDRCIQKVKRWGWERAPIPAFASGGWLYITVGSCSGWWGHSF